MDFMSQAYYKQNKPGLIHNQQFMRRLHEGIFILTFAVAIFLFLTLISYHNTDPAWSSTGISNGSSVEVANIGGRVGAWLADILFSAFGYVAYFFPLMILYAAWVPLQHHIFVSKDENPNNTDFNNDEGEKFNFARLLFILRTVGFFIVLFAASCLATIHLHRMFVAIPFGPGGILGDLARALMLKIFNPLSADLFLFAILLAGITLFSGLSWVKVSEVLGKLIMWLIDFVGKKVLQCNIFQREERQIAEKIEKLSAKREPKLTPVNLEAKETDPTIKKNILNDFNEREVKVGALSIITPQIIKPGARSEKERQLNLFEPELEGSFPPLSLLDLPEKNAVTGFTKRQLEELSQNVELRLRDFGIEAQVVAVLPGPVVTRFELQLAAGTKVSRITSLAKDLARSLSVVSVRIVEVIPGKSCIGLELPNSHREIVRLREILSSYQYEHSRAPLALALGKDISGNPTIVDLARMPHLLVAGTTGSGKSVCLNAVLLSLLYKYTPQELRMIMIDPKMLELSVYEGIAHLLTPVVTNMKEAANALRWCVGEMERRYKLMMNLGVRNIAGFNAKIREAKNKGQPILDPFWKEEMGDEPSELQELPYVVVIADEYADMIMVVGKKVEELIARIAQKARAAGIHLLLATQRPSVDVITGLIKANIPARIAFQVSSKIDSRTILDQSGAEQLLGYGDMLYLAPGSGIPVRIHGAFVADDEVHKVVNDLKRRGEPDYIIEIIQGTPETQYIPGIDEENPQATDDDSEKDPLYDQAVRIVTETRRASISGVQRRLKIGYNRAARLVEAMEAAGIVTPMESNGNREVLAPPPAGSDD